MKIFSGNKIMTAATGIFLAITLLSFRSRQPVPAPGSAPPLEATADLPAPSDWNQVTAVTRDGADTLLERPPESAVSDEPLIQAPVASFEHDGVDEALREFREWAAGNPRAALAGAMQLPEGEERDAALGAICLGVVQSNPADAVEIAQAIREPEGLAANLVQQWAGADLVSALNWTLQQPAGEQRDQCFEHLALVWSRSDPESAGGLVVEQIPPGPVQDEAIIMLVHQWGKKDLTAAALWVRDFPKNPLQERALAELEGIAQYQNELSGPHPH